jgi:PPM family protein phosphatase
MSESQVLTDEAVAKPNSADTVTLPASCPCFAVRTYGLTDQGKVRTSNEDHFLVAKMVKALQVELTSLPQRTLHQGSNRGYLFVVADGIGGHAAGAKASALAIDSVESFVLDSLKWFAPCKGKDQNQVLSDFQYAVQQVNARVLDEAAERPELHGMGTTLTLAYNFSNELYIAHVGDSRCYLSRGGDLHRLTRDHTVVDQLVRAGALAPADVARHHLRHVLTNTVGGHTPEVKAELHKIHLERGDRLLLCSDGLTEMVPEEKIRRIMDTESNPELACRQLVQCANDAGGKDNVTVVVAHFEAAE